jgi:hypothetical protein
MSKQFCFSAQECVFAAIVAFAISLAGCGGSSSTSTSPPAGNPVGSNLIQISSDSFTIGPGQHATEVEPHVISNGTTMVAAFQVGRLPKNPGVGGGSTDIGWATSTDGGATWTHGSLPGMTTGEGSGIYDAASDPAVAYDAKHGVWLISSLPLSATLQVPAVLVSRSTDGVNWGNPISVDATAPSSDKNWIVCDSWPSSPQYGNCYVEWDDPINFDEIVMSTSSDGGLTWGAPTATSGAADGIGGQPLVQPSGNVIVPIESTANPEMMAYRSTDGGANWSAPLTIATIQYHADAGGIRSGPLPSAAVDAAGTIWVVWEDCRFRANCATNDLVYSTSSDGVNWSAVTRIPIDDVSTSADYFIPGIGIDPATSGASAHLAVHYYYYPQTACDVSSCQLFVGYISSANGGSTWNTPTTLTAAPMELGWLPTSQNGLMVGDYIATAFVNGVPAGVFAVAQPTSGGNKGGALTFSEAIYTGKGLSLKMTAQQLSSAHDKPLHKVSDKIEQEVPEKGIVPPPRRRVRRSAK